MNRLVKDGSRVSFHNPLIVDENFLRENHGVLFIFGDNSRRFGKGGAAKLRNEPNAIGFITKKYPSNDESSFYNLKDYPTVFEDEKLRLLKIIEENKRSWILISKLGGGLANKYGIFENIIEPWLESLEKYKNVILLY